MGSIKTLIDFFSTPLASIALGMFLMYLLFFLVDVFTRKKSSEEEKASGPDNRSETSVSYPSRFKFLLEDEPEEMPADVNEEVQSLVRLYESRETSIYSILHRLLEYSKRISAYEKESESEKEDLNGQIREYKALAEKLTGIRDEQDESIRSLRNHLENTKHALREAKETHSTYVKNGEIEKVELEGRIKALGKDKTELTRNTTTLSETIDRLQSEKTELENRVADLSEELEQAVRDRDESKSEIESRLEHADGAKKELEAQIEQEREKNSDLENRLKEFRTRVTETAGELEEERISCEELKDQYDQRIHDLEDENRSLKERLSLSPDKEELEKAAAENEKMKAELNRYTKKYEEIEQEEKHILSELEEYRKKCSGLEEKAAQLEEQTETAEKELEKAQGTFKTDTEKQEQRIMSLEIENASLKTELSNSSGLKDAVAKLEKEKEELEEKVIEYRNQGTLAENGTDSDASESPVAKTLYKENKKLTRKTEEYLAEIDKLKVELSELEHLRMEHRRLKKEIESLKKNRTEEGEAAEGIRPPDTEGIQELEKTLAERDNEIERLNDMLENLEEETSSMKGEITKLHTEIKNKNQAFDKIEVQKKKLARHLTDMIESDDTESRDLVLSDIDLLSEIKEPGIPKAEDVPNIVNVEVAEEVTAESTQHDLPAKNEHETKATEDSGSGSKKVQPEKLYNIFLPKLTTQERKDTAVPLLTDIAGLSKKDAKKLVNKIVIPVVKGVDRDKADEIKERFMDAGILPRVKRQL